MSAFELERNLFLPSTGWIFRTINARDSLFRSEFPSATNIGGGPTAASLFHGRRLNGFPAAAANGKNRGVPSAAPHAMSSFTTTAATPTPPSLINKPRSFKPPIDRSLSSYSINSKKLQFLTGTLRLTRPNPVTTSSQTPIPSSPTTTTTKMRLPYAPEQPSSDADPSVSEIYSRVSARRSPRPLQPLDLALLHSPPLADGWNSFLGAVRTGTSLPPDIRETIILRVAALNSAVYEWEHHAPLALQSGISKDGVSALEYDEKYEFKETRELGDCLDVRQWSVVWYTDAMTRDVKVRQEVFDEVRGHFSEREVVEITGTVAAYNCVSRFLVALDVGEKNSNTVPVDREVKW